MAESIKSVHKEITKSAEDKRLYRGIELQNGMKILLVSDSTTDKSSAAMDVRVGEWKRGAVVFVFSKKLL